MKRLDQNDESRRAKGSAITIMIDPGKFFDHTRYIWPNQMYRTCENDNDGDNNMESTTVIGLELITS
jgi:hypothetical protein